MNSKRILEEMYEIVIKKSEEEIDENKFDKSILNCVNLRSPKEINEVLSDLLLILKSESGAIGEISNGEFVCYPEVIKKVEEEVIVRLSDEPVNDGRKKFQNETENEFEENIETERITDLLDRYDDLSDEEFMELLNNVGNMDESQFSDLKDRMITVDTELVDSGIIDEDDVKDDEKDLFIKRFSEGKDEIARKIAILVADIERENIPEIYKMSCKLELSRLLRTEELSEEVKEFCEKFKIYDIVKNPVLDNYSLQEDFFENYYSDELPEFLKKRNCKSDEKFLVKREISKIIKENRVLINNGEYEKLVMLAKKFAEKYSIDWKELEFSINKGMMSDNIEDEINKIYSNIYKKKYRGKEDVEKEGTIQEQSDINMSSIEESKVEGFFLSQMEPLEVSSFPKLNIHPDYIEVTPSPIQFSEKENMSETCINLENQIALSKEKYKGLFGSSGSKQGLDDAAAMMFGLATDKEDHRINPEEDKNKGTSELGDGNPSTPPGEEKE